MKSYDTVIFDLDGTLLDTLEDLMLSVNHALSGRTEVRRSLQEVRGFVGNGVRRLMVLSLPGGERNPQFEEAMADFRAHYAVHCRDHTRPYPQIMDMLRELKARGLKMGIVSNKPDAQVKDMNGEYFGGMFGAASIAQMKDGVHLLNFSRAELADAEALAAALESGKVASYVTDFPTQAVLKMKNAIAIPHLGASTPESEVNCADMAARELRDYLEDGQIRNSVNFPEIILGHSEGVRVLIIHENEPGMVSAISAAIGARKININNMLNKSRRDMAVTVLELDREPDDMLLTQLKALPGVIRLRLPAKG